MTQPKILVGLSLLLLTVAAAIADAPVTIRIYNDEADDVMTVYDMNAQPLGAVLANQSRPATTLRLIGLAECLNFPWAARYCSAVDHRVI